MSSSRPWNRSRNGTGPSGPTTSTVPSNSTIGSRRRAAAMASPSRVWAFSRTRSSSRAVCQVARSRTGGWPGSAVVGSSGVVVMVSSVVSRAGQRRTTSCCGHQNRLATRPELIAAVRDHADLHHRRGHGQALGPHPRRPDSRSPTAMSLAAVPSLYPGRSTAREENLMTATYTFDVFSSLDGYGAAGGDWTGYWGKQGPELLEHRLALYREEQRMVFGAKTFRAFVRMLASSTEESEVRDPWVTRMVNAPATVVSKTLTGPVDWPDATVVSGDAVEVVARLKEESEMPLRSHGSLSLNRALMAAGLVDFVHVTLFPVITGKTGLEPIFQGAADFDLQLVESCTLDGHVQELIYRPSIH